MYLADILKPRGDPELLESSFELPCLTPVVNPTVAFSAWKFYRFLQSITRFYEA